MLHSLEYSVEFPTTGKTFANRIEFEPGLTAITGRNEAGKSLIIEMIGYCLWGKQALRGQAADYRNLTAELALTLNDQVIRIERRPRSEALKIDGEIVAVGPDAINRMMPSLLGFDMAVWNIACVAQQGDLEALTNMRPTARKAMIDQLIGLDKLEGVERDCRTEATAHSRVAEKLASSLMMPTEPVRPENYVEASEIEAKLIALRERQATRAQLLRISKPEQPLAPVAPDINDDIEAYEQTRLRLEARKGQLEATLRALPEATVTSDQLQAAVAYREYQQECQRRGPRPDYSVEQLREWQDIWHKKAHLDDTVTCPKCDHEFMLEGGWSVEEVRKLPDPPIDIAECGRQAARHLRWTDELVEPPKVIVADIEREKRAISCVGEREAVLIELNSIKLPEDRSHLLRAFRQYQTNLAVWAERQKVYERDLKQWHEAQTQLAELVDANDDIDRLQTLVIDVRSYESARNRYEADLERYEAMLSEANQAREQADGYRLGVEALRAARARVKAELAPSLSRASSSLLALMTAGERTSIVVDEEFNITVDGQPIQTLSGSGKGVVNLALRIGLGQVLTAKIMPVFLGDEIDAAFDNDRARSTHATLQTLKEYLKQIIIVSHKADVVCDNRIEV